jgi:hypothetical protein
LEVALEIFNNERPINQAEVEVLAKYFHVDKSLFT